MRTWTSAYHRNGRVEVRGASSPAIGLGRGPNADVDVRVPPGLAASRYAGVLARKWTWQEA